jgi:autotransporter-associated beta strand protein
MLRSADGTWEELTGGSWGNAENWVGDVIADGAGSVANFSTLNITNAAHPTITLDTARTIGRITFGDATTGSAANWTLSDGGNDAYDLTLSGANAGFDFNQMGFLSTVTVSADIILSSNATTTMANSNFTAIISGDVSMGANNLSIGTNSNAHTTISGVISGTGKLTKGNQTGNLTIMANNSAGFQGQVEVQRGQLIVGHDGALGTGTLSFLISNDQQGGIQSFDTTARSIGNAVVIGGNGGSTFNFGTAATGNLTFTNSTAIALPGVRRFSVGGRTTFNAGFTGAGGGINKLGAGTLVLAGASTYTGATTVTAGTLLVNGSTGSSTITVGTIDINGNPTNLGRLGGTGIIGGGVVIQNGSTLAPGESAGLLTANGLTMNNGSIFEFELFGNTTAGRGTAYDGLNLTSTTANTLVLGSTLTASLIFNGTGSTVNFNDVFWDSDHSWLVIDANSTFTPGTSSIFSTINTSLDASNQAFSTTGGSFNFSQSGDDVFLNYVAVPEPGVAVLLGLAGVLFPRRRR